MDELLESKYPAVGYNAHSLSHILIITGIMVSLISIYIAIVIPSQIGYAVAALFYGTTLIALGSFLGVYTLVNAEKSE